MKHMVSILFAALAVAGGCGFGGGDEPVPESVSASVAAPGGNCDIVEAARRQIGVTVGYDPSYRSLAYPGGDVPRRTGVCTDVIVRALRDARGADLQKLVHEDMERAFSAYPNPRKWGLSRPDPNIDHRRVLNLRTFFRRVGWEVAATRDAKDYAPGDFVTVEIGSRRQPHIMIVSDRRGGDGAPLVIHNIGSGVREDDDLFAYAITGHYRIPAPAADAGRRTQGQKEE